MNSEETKKLGEPEGQFEKIRIKRQPDGAINICIAIAISYRYQSKAKTQKLLTNVHEAKNGMAQAIREAEEVSKNHYPLVFAKAQWSKDRVYKYRDYLKKLKEFYQRTLVAKNWEELYKERPHSNAEEKEFHEHFYQRTTVPLLNG